MTTIEAIKKTARRVARREIGDRDAIALHSNCVQFQYMLSNGRCFWHDRKTGLQGSEGARA